MDFQAGVVHNLQGRKLSGTNWRGGKSQYHLLLVQSFSLSYTREEVKLLLNVLKT